MVKTLFRCTECYRYTLKSDSCPACGAPVIHPYPARFSIIKEQRLRKYVKQMKQN